MSKRKRSVQKHVEKVVEVEEEEDEEDEQGLEEDDNDDEEDGDEEDDDEEDDDEEDDEDEDGDDEDADDVNDTDNEDRVDDLVYDVYNLTACDYHSMKNIDKNDVDNFNNQLKENATRGTQLLIQRLFGLPSEQSEVGPLALLPSEIFRLPREKAIPEPKAQTKWEKYALEKGIKNKKRERMVFDEDSQEYKPRYGYKRTKNGLEDVPIIEVKQGADPYADPWTEDKNEKKKRIEKNTKQQLKNQFRAMKTSNGGSNSGNSGSIKSFDPSKIPGIPIDMVKKGGKRGKEGLKSALQLVQHSTASMGRFDELRKGEPLIKMKGKKHSYRDNLESVSVDQSKMKANLRIVNDKVDKKSRGVTNSLAAYEGIIPDAPESAFKQKKGRVSFASSSGSNKKRRTK